MALVEVDDIEFGAPQPDKIHAFSIDAPRIGGRNVYDIELAGWVLGIDQPVQEIEIHQGGAVIRKAPLDRERPDVARDYPDSPGSGTCGFRTWVSVIGLEPGANLQVRAVLADGTRARLGGIALRHQPVQSGFEPRLQPLMLTTMGRAGTTWTMRLLSEHPEIVVHRWHPYELRTARYWWHMLKTLSEPRDPYHSAQADRFQTNKQWVGYNPFYPEPIAVTPGLGEWMGRDYVEDLGSILPAQRRGDLSAHRGRPGSVQCEIHGGEAPRRQSSLARLGALSKGERDLSGSRFSRCLQFHARLQREVRTSRLWAGAH